MSAMHGLYQQSNPIGRSHSESMHSIRLEYVTQSIRAPFFNKVIAHRCFRAHDRSSVCPYLGAGISVIPSKLLCSKVCRVAHILPPEDAGPQALVTRSYFGPQECRPLNRRPTPRKTRKNDEQKIQERQEIKINAGQRH